MDKFKLKTFKKGVHFDDAKSLTENCAIESMPLLENYYLPLSQHLGAPATSIVLPGQEVAEGQLVAQASGFVSANIYSPISGKVVGIINKKNKLGVTLPHIHIKREGNRRVYLAPIDVNNSYAIRQRILEAGIVGLGGAGFPTHIKVVPSKPVDVLLINAAECEPYLNCDNRLIIEQTLKVVEGAKLIAKSIGTIKKIVIGIEENKLTAYQALKDYKGIGDIEVVLLKKKYPQGGEKQLIYACLNRKVPTKSLPMDVGVVVQNVATCFAVYQAVIENEPLYQRVLTVSGLGVETPKNLWVKNGTLYADIIEYCGGLKGEVKKIIIGGPMMGVAVSGLKGVVTKTDSGILAMTTTEVNLAQPSACINCSTCAKVCPMNLMPMYIDFYTLAKDYGSAVKYGVEHCIECGCCAYSCPAKRTLVQSVKLCKAKLKEKK